MISVPSKTFIAGEYLALDGGLNLTALTSPRFELRSQAGGGGVDGIPAGSPADRFRARHGDFFSERDLKFVDPFAGAGGWGASTAQYLALCALRAGRDWKPNLNELLSQYRADAWSGEGRPPSGADLIGQWNGGFTFFEESTGTLRRSEWPFPRQNAFAVRTGVKLATHEHLRALGDVDTSAMAAAMTGIAGAWQGGDAETFAEGINNYRRALEARKLVAESTLSLLHDVLWMDGVKAAKGCGAMGADVIFAFVEKEHARGFLLWAEERELLVTNLAARSSGGLQ